MNITLLVAYLVFFGGLLYVLLILPQRRRARAQRSMLESIKSGDEIVTVGGMFGTVKAHDDEKVELEIAKGVTIKVANQAVGQIVSASELHGSDTGE